MFNFRLYTFLFFALICASLRAQRPAYFIDGYHGGIYGHIPPWQTKFMVEKLQEFPDWKINLELEPESWDTIAVHDRAAYEAFAARMTDQSAQGRIEYINPAYGQSYLYNIPGESIIRQLYYGMRKLRQHFPGLVFSTYSSEEPCFTSALPQILRSFGFSYASLKNPNTCWGGYTRAYGGELVNWVGSDGSRILTVPRYAVEGLKPGSTWETIAANNSLAYVLGAFRAGIDHPVGMCLQDAGWSNGPWIKAGEVYRAGADEAKNDVTRSYHPTVYTTWRGYFGNIVGRAVAPDWHFSQEDVLTSLVWGGQILQEVARKVRKSENRMVTAEKLAAMAAVWRGAPWPGVSLDEAWRTLLLSQHHDCWIVPYNRRQGLSWADYVDQWTRNTDWRCDSVVGRSMAMLAGGGGAGGDVITVFNVLPVGRDECVEVGLPAGWESAVVTDEVRRPVLMQRDSGRLLFRAHVPPIGYAVYRLRRGKAPTAPGARVSCEKKGACQIETDLYSLTIDPDCGGVITRLATKGANAKVFTETGGLRKLNELRGNFYREGGYHSSTQSPAQVNILENGPLRVRLAIRSSIAGTPFTQLITLVQGEPRIDVRLQIDWAADHKIGESPDSVRGAPLKKEFYNDSFKLQVLFPVALERQKIYKNAPFDVSKSRLADTFFDSWDSIKNTVVLNWVDVADNDDQYGLTVLSDETTSYAHGAGYPLALTVQYSGPGLFGRDYSITGPTTMDYALLPHSRRWDEAGVWTAATRFDQPLLVRQEGVDAAVGQTETIKRAGQPTLSRSLLHLSSPGWEVSAITVEGADLDVRLFNAEGKDSLQRMYLGFPVSSASEVALDGRVERQLDIRTNSRGETYITLTSPRYGIRTIKFKDVVK